MPSTKKKVSSKEHAKVTKIAAPANAKLLKNNVVRNALDPK
jgi:hypothetical protein